MSDENIKLETANEKLSVEVEYLKKDCHIYLEALILYKHRIFGKSSKHREVEGQQSFFNESETEYIEKSDEPVSKTVKGHTRKIRKPGGFVARLKTEMLKEEVLHCDETYVKVLKEQDISGTSKQYMWMYRTRKHSERQIVIYDYNKSSSGYVANKFLGEFSGYLHTDGYAGYNRLTKGTHCNCWTHLRRKFHEAIVVNSENSIAKTGRDFCDKLFAVVSELDRLTTEEQFKQRLMQEKSMFEAF